jgi:hypothetical protein
MQTVVLAQVAAAQVQQGKVLQVVPPLILDHRTILDQVAAAQVELA